MFEKILIANRGEIACRIIRTCRRMGIRTAAVYSESDARALHVQLADEACCIGKSAPAESYLRIENVLDAGARHYISRAQTQTGGRVTRAASLLGYEHYQVLNRKIKNLGLKNDA